MHVFRVLKPEQPQAVVFFKPCPNICNLDSDSSCLCVSFCKHCSQSAVSSVSAAAASTVSALNFSDRNHVGDLNFQGQTETDGRNTSYSMREKYLRLNFDYGKDSEQTMTNLQYFRVLHLGWSSMCFTALVRLIDSQVLRRVLCFFLLPDSSNAWQTSQLQA